MKKIFEVIMFIIRKIQDISQLVIVILKMEFLIKIL